MNQINHKQLKYAESLSRIELNDQERVQMLEDMNYIFKNLTEFHQMKTDEILPLYSILEQDLALRQDEIKPFSNPQALLNPAAKTKDGYFVTHQTVE